MTAMTWADVMDSPYLKDLPFKIELNRWGKIEMSPITNERGAAQAQIALALGQRVGGKATMNCSIQTADGVRVADAAWVSDQRFERLNGATPYPHAPEICVEVKLPSDTWPEMEMKADLYLGAGAEEVWIVDLDNNKRVIRA